MTALLGAFSEHRAKIKEEKPLISLSLFSRFDSPPTPPAFVCISVSTGRYLMHFVQKFELSVGEKSF